MTDEEILEIGVQAKMNPTIMTLGGNFKLLKTFAKLVAEREREACAKIVDVQNMTSKSTYKEQLETKDKPVSCAECGADGGHALYCVACAEKFIAQTKTKDEPVATVISESGANVTHSWWHEPALAIGTKLYTSPQRTWVGLTDEEQSFVYDQVKQIVGGKPFWVKFADAIEAKLKEKNT